jgi:hypothetical protein
VPEYANGGFIPGNEPIRCELRRGEPVLTASGKVLRFDGERLVDTGECWSRERLRAVLERLNGG